MRRKCYKHASRGHVWKQLRHYSSCLLRAIYESDYKIAKERGILLVNLRVHLSRPQNECLLMKLVLNKFQQDLDCWVLRLRLLLDSTKTYSALIFNKKKKKKSPCFCFTVCNRQVLEHRNKLNSARDFGDENAIYLAGQICNAYFLVKKCRLMRSRKKWRQWQSLSSIQQNLSRKKPRT